MISQILIPLHSTILYRYQLLLSMRLLLFLSIFILFSPYSEAQHGDLNLYAKWYNNLYTQTKSFDENGNRMEEAARTSFLTSILEITANQNDHWNFGFDLYYRASYRDSTKGSPFEVLKLRNNNVDARAALSHVGPKLVWSPRRNEYITLLFLIPLDNTPSPVTSDIPFLDNTGYQAWLRYGVNIHTGKQWYTFLELAGVYRFDRQGVTDPSDLLVPVKIFQSYFFPKLPIGLFLSSDFTSTFGSSYAYYWQLGGGVKIYPGHNWEIELSYGTFVLGKNNGAGESINLGVAHKWPLKDGQSQPNSALD